MKKSNHNKKTHTQRASKTRARLAARLTNGTLSTEFYRPTTLEDLRKAVALHEQSEALNNIPQANPPRKKTGGLPENVHQHTEKKPTIKKQVIRRTKNDDDDQTTTTKTNRQTSIFDFIKTTTHHAH